MMSRILKHEQTIFDLMDLLHFNQITVWTIYSKEEQSLLKRIVAIVNSANAKRGITGLDAELIKHYVLSGLEIYLEDFDQHQDLASRLMVKAPEVDIENYRKIFIYNQNFNMAMLLALASKKQGINNEFLIEVFNEVQAAVQSIPKCMLFRLAERCYATEFPDGALNFLIKMVSLGVINNAQFRNSDPNNEIPDTPELIRACLLVELECLRSFIGRKTDAANSITQNIKRLSDIKNRQERERLGEHIHAQVDAIVGDSIGNTMCFMVESAKNPIFLKAFFKNSQRYMNRTRAFNGTKARWLGLLAAYSVEQRHIQAKRINAKERPIYNVKSKEEPLSDEISRVFADKGVPISARIIYDRHKEYLQTTKKLMEIHHQLLYSEQFLPLFEQDLTYQSSFQIVRNMR